LRKNYVLDTNVLLHDPRALFQFKDNNVIIPIYVVEEIDKFKRDLSELGRNARQVSRDLDAFREENGSLTEGVPLESGGTLRVLFTERELPRELMNQHIADNRILALAMDVKEREPNLRCVFVTKDINLRIRADALGLVTEDYENDKIENPEVYMGVRELEVGKGDIDDFYARGELAPPDGVNGVYPNEFALLKDRNAPNHTALSKYSAQKGRFVPLLKSLKEGAWGLRPRNKEQSFALDLLLNDEIKLVTIVGKAGTGKTLLAIAAGLQKTMEEQVYQKMLVSRPVFPLGKDIGFLPGTVEEKLNPWMQPIYDNVEFLMGLSRPQLQRADRSRAGRDRTAHVHPRPQHSQPVHRGRRGAEPHATRGEDHHHEGGRQHQDRAHGRPLPDRQSLRGFDQQWPRSRGQQVQARAPGGAHHPHQR